MANDAQTPARCPRWRLVLHGKAAGDDAVRDAVAALRESGVDLSVRVTWEPGDARRYAEEAIDEGVDVLIAGGGDGSVGMLAAALAERPEDVGRLPSLAILPLGTANDLARAAGIPDDPLAGLALVRDSVAQPVDLLRVATGDGTRWCVNVASGGFGTEATVEADEGLKKVLGGFAYWLTGVARLGRIEPLSGRLAGPGLDWAGHFIALGIGNGRQAGGGQPLCPDALLDDGQLDLTVIPPLEGALGQAVATLLTEGREQALDEVAVRVRLPWLEVSTPRPLVLNLDGEPVEARDFRIECVRGRIRMHLPPGCPLLGVPGASAAVAAELPADRLE